MTITRTEAERLHAQLPRDVLHTLERAGISRREIRRRVLGWNGWAVSVPIFTRDINVAYLEYWQVTERGSVIPGLVEGPQTLTEIYGWETLALSPPYVVLCEGTFECAVVAAQGFDAVAMPGSGHYLSPDAREALSLVPEVFIAFSRRARSRAAAREIKKVLPDPRLVSLPPEYGEQPISEFFRRGGTRRDFLKLLAYAGRPA